MPRKPRVDMPGYYHVINRGANRQPIFTEKEDKEKFLKFLEHSRDSYQFIVHSFCILDNRYHLLIETTRDNLSLAVRYVNSRYAAWFNKKMQRVGPLWQGRFKSWYIHNEDYLWLLIRYIETNPVKAGLAHSLGDFPFSASFSVLNGKKPSILRGSCLLQKDVQEWLLPLTANEQKIFTDFQAVRMEREPTGLKIVKREALGRFFYRDCSKCQRNFEIYHAYMAGHTQADICVYTGLSAAAVSRIVEQVRQTIELFLKMRDKGLFWSYSRAIEFSPDKQDLLIETVLKFADIAEILQLFQLFGKRDVFSVWKENVRDDARFKKLNYFLARVFFNMNVEADQFNGGPSARAEKLRLLAR